MTLITRLFCLVVIWTVVMHTQTDAVSPLVMAVHTQPYQFRRITITDLTEVNVENLKLPLDGMEPSYIVLLCGETEENSTNKFFSIKQISRKIDSIDKHFTCAHHLQPIMREYYPFVDPCTYHIGFEIRLTDYILFKNFSLMILEEAAGIESFKLLADLNKRLPEDHTGFRYYETYLKIHYDFENNIPKFIEHKVKAWMHSNTYEEKCEKIDVQPENVIRHEKRPYDDLLAQFKSEPIAGHKWRQLVPIHDFKGTYTTKGTCTYLNYVLLHEDAIKTLTDIEIFIRIVADVLNEVSVFTGTYIKKDNNSDPETEKKENTIPTIVWKKITYSQNSEEYAILAVIHNQETKRICNEKNTWGWPNDNKNEQETGIGIMYYCLMNSKLSRKLGIITYNEYLPFNTREVPYKDEKIDIPVRMVDNLSSPKIEEESR